MLTAGGWPSPGVAPVGCPSWTRWSRPWTAPGTPPASPAASAPPAWTEASSWRTRTRESSAESALSGEGGACQNIISDFNIHSNLF